MRPVKCTLVKLEDTIYMIYVTKDLTDLDLNPGTRFVLVRLHTHVQFGTFSARKCVCNCKSKTRQSSCVNARGIPTAAYQALRVQSCPREVGYPGRVPPGWGTPPSWPGWGEYHGWVPPLAGVPPVLTWPGRRYPKWVPPGWGTPHPDLAGGYPWQAPSGQDDGVPWPGQDGWYPGWVPPGWGTPPPIGPGWGTSLLDLAGVPPQVWTDRQTDMCQNIIFPSYYVRGR